MLDMDAQKMETYSLGFHKDIYSKAAVMKTAYLFVEQFYMYIDMDAENNIVVTFKPKAPLEKREVDSMLGQFQNELLHQSVRLLVSQQTRGIRELIMGRALFSTVIEKDSVWDDDSPASSGSEVGKDYHSDDGAIGSSYFERVNKKEA